jgi:hypothetical protein
MDLKANNLHRLITISHGKSAGAETRLFDLLEVLMPVTFSYVSDSRSNVDIVASADIGTGLAAVTLTAPIASGEGSQALEPSLHQVTFADDLEVPFPFRSRTIGIQVAGCISNLAPDERVLARCDTGALWTVVERAGAKHFRSAMPLPRLSQGASFFQLFNSDRVLEALTLLHALRIACAKNLFDLPPLRAAFILDDPNLHWPSYGHVDFRQLAIRGRSKGYHVSMATIPMDSWFVHSGAAKIFREYPDSLSLMIHGINHAPQELAASYSPLARSTLLRQAILRIESLERKSDLDVSRVMVPPHGACSAVMLAALPRNGFEGACISSGSLRHHNAGQEWVTALGFAPAELINGCPVMPRWGMTDRTRNALLVAAYLGQPMIVRGHQQDLKEGPGVFDDFADFINALGPVQWSNLAGLARLNFQSKREDNTQRVRVLGLRADLDLPADATHMSIEGAGVGGGSGPWRWSSPAGDGGTARSGDLIRIEGLRSRRITIEDASVSNMTQDSELEFRPNVKMILRRIATEARDRFLSF